MSFTARIPKYIVFRKRKTDEESTTSTTSWLALSASDELQTNAKKLSEDVIAWDYWGEGYAAEIYAEDSNAFVHINEPCKLRLTGYHQHGAPSNDRRSIQVATPSGHVVGMPHDVFINAILSSGFKKTTRELPGTYVLAYVNRRLIPVQIKSGLHQAILKHVERSQRKSLTARELTVGHIYTSAAGNTALFLGYVNTETMVTDLPRGAMQYPPSYRDKPDYSQPAEDFGVRFLPKTLATLWYQTDTESWQGIKYSSEEIALKMSKDFDSEKRWYFQCKKQHRFVEVVPNYFIDTPDDIVMQIRSLNERNLSQRMIANRTRRSNYLGYYATVDQTLNSQERQGYEPPDVLRHFDAFFAQFHSAECNMTLYGMGIIRADVFKQFDPWETKPLPKVVKKKIT